MPAVVLVAMFSGLATAVEASALIALYALVVQTVVHRDFSIRRDLLRVFTECCVVVGGVLVIDDFGRQLVEPQHDVTARASGAPARG